MRLYLLGVYYTVLTIATVGYGDITPNTQGIPSSPQSSEPTSACSS